MACVSGILFSRSKTRQEESSMNIDTHYLNAAQFILYTQWCKQNDTFSRRRKVYVVIFSLLALMALIAFVLSRFSLFPAPIALCIIITLSLGVMKSLIDCQQNHIDALSGLCWTVLHEDEMSNKQRFDWKQQKHQ